MMVKVVELLRRDENLAVTKLARFVLNDGGGVDVVGLVPNGKAVAESMIANGIPGPKSQQIKREQGEQFLPLLKEAFRGSRIWASDVIEMAEVDARADK